MSVAGASSSSEAWLAGSEAWLVVSASAAAAAGEASTLGTGGHRSPGVGLWTAPSGRSPSSPPPLSSGGHHRDKRLSKPNKTNPHPQIPLRGRGFAHLLTGEPLPAVAPLTHWWAGAGLTIHPRGDPEGPFSSLSLSILICKAGTPGTHPHTGVRTFSEHLLCVRPLQEPGMNSPSDSPLRQGLPLSQVTDGKQAPGGRGGQA